MNIFLVNAYTRSSSSHSVVMTSEIIGRCAYVNLANLDKLPSKGATVFALPMKITHGTGGLPRIFAKLGGECPTTGAGRSLTSGQLFQIITFLLMFKFLM